MQLLLSVHLSVPARHICKLSCHRAAPSASSYCFCMFVWSL